MRAPHEQIQHGINVTAMSEQSLTGAVEMAVAAEEGGWDGVFVSDSIYFGAAEPWTVLSAIAARTERIKLGTWITPVPQLQPWRLAHSIATLDRLSNGRVIFGAGLGTRPEYERLGEVYDGAALGRRYDEALELIVQLWQGKPVTFHGEFYDLRELTLPITPVQQPRVPILTAAWWPNRQAFRRATRWDGLMPYWPALLGDQTGPEGQQSSGRPVEDELREMLEYYHSLTDDPGEILIPRGERDDGEYRELCAELGVTWLLPYFPMDLDEVRQGPPRS